MHASSPSSASGSTGFGVSSNLNFDSSAFSASFSFRLADCRVTGQLNLMRTVEKHTHFFKSQLLNHNLLQFVTRLELLVRRLSMNGGSIDSGANRRENTLTSLTFAAASSFCRRSFSAFSRRSGSACRGGRGHSGANSGGKHTLTSGGALVAASSASRRSFSALVSASRRSFAAVRSVCRRSSSACRRMGQSNLAQTVGKTHSPNWYWPWRASSSALRSPPCAPPAPLAAAVSPPPAYPPPPSKGPPRRGTSS
jgi:hypothetical protein